MKTNSLVANPIKPTSRRIHAIFGKTAIVSLVVIGTNVFANYALTRGLRQVGVVESWSPWPYVEAFARPWVAVGVVFMATWLVTRLALLSIPQSSMLFPAYGTSSSSSAYTCSQSFALFF